MTGLSGLTQFQGGECKQCKHQGADPEADDDFGLAPAKLLEVVVQRRHLEDALLCAACSCRPGG